MQIIGINYLLVQEKRVKYHFFPKFSIFIQQWPSKQWQGHKILFIFSAYQRVVFMQIVVKIKVSIQEILGIISFFDQN